MVLVALAMIAIIAMAALSIDVITLYLAREEAQRSADAAAITAARVLSLSGVTGDTNNIVGSLPAPPWPQACALATQLAQAVANQTAVGSTAATTVNVTFLYNGTTTDCTSAGGNGGFAINPQVQVQVIRQALPTLFSRIWRRSTNSVSATAIAEAFNPSNSGTITLSASVVPVSPRCVKPWIIPNQDPSNGNNPFVSTTDGSINNQGIQFSGAGPGVIGERTTWTNACGSKGSDCDVMKGSKPAPGSYIPALITPPATAVPTCADDSDYQKAIGGCDPSDQSDQNTVYACGTQNRAHADLTINPGADTAAAAQCLIRQPGQDKLNMAVFPYQIQPGSDNPVITSGVITSSNSIVTLPIYDQNQGGGKLAGNNPTVTIVGFLQVFINLANPDGSLDLTILNVAGCSSNTSNPAVAGSSPVPIRLITSP
jgi:hypothetical protein